MLLTARLRLRRVRSIVRAVAESAAEYPHQRCRVRSALDASRHMVRSHRRVKLKDPDGPATGCPTILQGFGGLRHSRGRRRCCPSGRVHRLSSGLNTTSAAATKHSTLQRNCNFLHLMANQDGWVGRLRCGAGVAWLCGALFVVVVVGCLTRIGVSAFNCSTACRQQPTAAT